MLIYRTGKENVLIPSCSFGTKQPRKFILINLYVSNSRTEIITGHGFESNQDMTVYVIQNIEGIFYVDENGGTAQPEVKALPPDSTKKDSVK